MFDFGFSEMLLIAVIALIVVGPQRLPKVARTAGHLLGRMQRYVSDVKADVSREMQLDELKKLQKDVQEQARDLEQSVRKQADSVESEFRKTTSEVHEGLDGESDAALKPPMDPAPSAASWPNEPSALGQPTQPSVDDATTPDQTEESPAQSDDNRRAGS
jgi:sec-independent protein translocase protein TatB